MTSMVTLWPTKDEPLRDPSLIGGEDDGRPSLVFYIGDAYVSFHDQTPDSLRKFAAELIAAAGRWEAKVDEPKDLCAPPSFN
jgi:hypothetical protein